LIGMASAYSFMDRRVRRMLRRLAAISVMVTIAFVSPANSAPTAPETHTVDTSRSSAVSDMAAMHCHRHAGSVEPDHPAHHPHACCSNSGCACPPVSAVVDPRMPSAGPMVLEHLLIAATTRTRIPLGLRSPVFRPPIA